jgi:hypothetical protein
MPYTTYLQALLPFKLPSKPDCSKEVIIKRIDKIIQELTILKYELERD